MVVPHETIKLIVLFTLSGLFGWFILGPIAAMFIARRTNHDPQNHHP
jgi:hypothetical protein